MLASPVLLLQHRLVALTYLVPEDTPPGTVVTAPLGSRKIQGVVWDANVFDTGKVDPSKLKAIDSVTDTVFIPKPLRQLIEFVSDYYIAAPSSVLRMALPQSAFLPEGRRQPDYVLGPAGQSSHPARQELLEKLEAVRDIGPASLATWAEAVGVTTTRLRALVKSGIFVETKREQKKKCLHVKDGPKLADTQEVAAAELANAVFEQKFLPFLLEGVTGSGKTEIYLEAIAEALKLEKQALVLLPEISLTEAWMSRFEGRFGFQPVLWHSGLTPAQRRHHYHAIANGDAHVIVGARSALFLPAPNLGVIVVDEAHESAFKQEETVPYHGRDVAVMRAKFEDIPVILATATPGVETLEQVERGTYRHIHIAERFGGAALPQIHLVDMVRHPAPRGRWISPPLEAAVNDRLEKKEQSLLFLNRRGFAPLTLCRTCGERIECPNCTAWLVEHRHAGRLSCHHCGHNIPRPNTCPSCEAEESLVACGPGVERLAGEVEALWPEARTLVATSDTIRTRSDLAGLIEAAASGDVDILIGTQILAKGHNFPDLTLVGVIDADLGLSGGDLRAAERSFQQIAQVAGRSGRAEKPGEAYLQTYQPHERVMQALASGDSARFIEAEREARMAANMPPFGRLAAIIISSTKAEDVSEAGQMLVRAAPAAEGFYIYGPAPAPLAMLRGRYRHRLLVHARRQAPLQKYIRHWLKLVKLPSSVRLTIDVDPQSFL